MKAALIGFMGAGKSSAGRLVNFVGTVDTDQLLARLAGRDLEELIQSDERAFRRAEADLVTNLLAGEAGLVVLGAGAIESEEVRRALKDCGRAVIHAEVGFETSWQRIGGRRPLAATREQLLERYQLRVPLYAEAAQVHVPEGEDLKEALDFVGELEGLGEGKLIWSLGRPVWNGPGFSYPLQSQGRRFLIADSSLPDEWVQSLEPEAVIRLEAGEGAKSFAVAERCFDWLAEEGVRRDDHLAVLGGGTLGDLAGFVASTYLRGIELLQVPTTLVAQVDSALGGKSALNLAAGKNLVGSHWPAAVISNQDVLFDLPRYQLAEGYVELLRTALISGGGLWDQVRNFERVEPGPELDRAVFAAQLTSARIYAADERDQGPRLMLNLGHTLGHAFEAAAGFELSHGQAVALGLVAELRLSDQAELAAFCSERFRELGLPVSLDRSIKVEEVLDRVALDKKASSDGVGFIGLEGVGRPVSGVRYEDRQLIEAIETLR